MNAESPQEELKRQNESIVLNLILQHAPISRAQLTEQTGLSAQTITNIARRFMNDELIVEIGVDDNGNIGRKRINLDINSDGAYAIGFNIERDRMVKALVNLRGEVIHQDIEELPPMESPLRVTQQIVDYTNSILNDSTFRDIRAKVAGIGIGTPGPIDYTKGSVVEPPNLPEWTRVHLRDDVKAQLGIPVVLDNSSTVAALGEHWRGRWGHRSFFYCYWGMGIGGGLISNDTIYRGSTGNAMEFGHVAVEPNGILCECGGYGCLEAYASIPSIIRQAKAYGDYRELAEITSDAKPGRPLYRLLERAAEYFAQALVSTLNLLDVDLVVIGGHNFAEVQSIFFPVIKQYVTSRILRAKVGNVEIGLSTLGEEAGAIGAASFVFHETLLTNGSRVVR